MTTTLTTNKFLAKTYSLLSTSLLVFAVSILVGLQFVPIFTNPIIFFSIFTIELGLIFAIHKWKTVPLLMAFAICTGLTTIPLMADVLGTTSGLYAIAQALIGTAIITGGTSMYALTTKKDFSAFGPFLFWTLVAIIAVAILNIFIGSSILSTILSIVALIVFSGFMIYDTQNIVKGLYETPVEAALSLYLNVINIFIHLLSLLKSDD